MNQCPHGAFLLKSTEILFGFDLNSTHKEKTFGRQTSCVLHKPEKNANQLAVHVQTLFPETRNMYPVEEQRKPRL